MYPIKFIHTADLHLGKRLYNISQRYDDYFRAFRWILNKAVEESVDFILICGDLIDSEQKINSATIRDIITSIQSFHSKSKNKLNRKIPIVCIEGNHETPFFSDHTWLKLLADLDLIIMLSGRYVYDKNNSLTFEEYSQNDRSGGKIQIKNANIYGLSFFGSSTPELFPLIEHEIKKEEGKFNILMMHFGVSGEDKRKVGASDLSKPLMKLHNSVDYLALGHFHTQYVLTEEDPWIFNPGSLEVNEITEYEADHGALLVQISSEKNNFNYKPLLCENGNTNDLYSIPNRRFFSLSSIDIGEINSFEEAQEYIIDRLKKYGVPLKSNHATSKENLDVPILYFSIVGMIRYSQLEVDLSKLRERIFNTFDILGLMLHNRVFSLMEGDIQLEEELTIDEIERELILATIESEEPYRPYKEKIVDFILDLKGDLRDKPDYNLIKSNADKWFELNTDLYNQFLKIIEIQRKQKAQIKPKKIKKKKKRKIKEVVVEEEWEDSDFDKAFEFGDLLDGDSKDSLIDDGDLDL